VRAEQLAWHLLFRAINGLSISWSN
jgi:hypothetical protein